MKKHSRRSNPPSVESGAAARERRYDAIQRRRSRRRNPPMKARQGILCYDPASGTLKGDASSPFNEMEADLAQLFENSATVLVRNEGLPNGELIVPLCPDKSLVAAVAELAIAQPTPPDPTEGCCVDEVTGLITCPGGKEQWNMHGVAVPMATLGCTTLDDGTRWCTIHTGDNRFELPACAPPPPPPPPDVPDLTGCCVDEKTGLITCPGGVDQWYMHGRTVPMATLGCTTLDDGTRWCTIHTGDNRFELPACPQPPPPPPPPECCVDVVNMVLVCADESYALHGAQVVEILAEQDDGLLSVSLVDPVDGLTKNGRFYPCEQPPQECCYDVASGKLRCVPSGPFDGLSVSLMSMQAQEDGSIAAIVMSPELKPNSTIVVPVCDDPVVDCCYDPRTERLVCPGGELDGEAAGVVQAWVGPDGQIYVWAAWQGGAARMPLCPGTEECPPVFCCVNMNTMTYVCPGRPELNDQAAPIAEIVTEDGYSWALLEDGTRVPMCGERCPPPQLCPDCPTCPPGQWMSPDGTCETPDCPPPPPPPPGKEPCCDECAEGRECSGCDDDAKAGGHRRARHGGKSRRVFNPQGRRHARAHYAGADDNPHDRSGPRKRKIFSGNR